MLRGDEELVFKDRDGVGGGVSVSCSFIACIERGLFYRSGLFFLKVKNIRKTF